MANSITVNGLPVLSLSMLLPGIGVGVIEVDASGDTALSGTVAIKDDSLSWAATAVRSGVFTGRSRAKLVLGTGGMRAEIPAKSYTGVTVKSVLTELLAAAGESFDTESTASVLSRVLPYWTRPKATAATAISGLAHSVGAVWRVRPSGKVWFGVDSYATQTFAHVAIDQDDIEGRYTIASDHLELRPGVTFNGRRVSRVRHVVNDAGARTHYWVES